MSTKFNLERFKAGEPAYDSMNDERNFVGWLPDGKVVVSFKLRGVYNVWPLDVNEMEHWTMKPKEEWTYVHPDCLFATKELAEQYLKEMRLSESTAVKIIRE